MMKEKKYVALFHLAIAHSLKNYKALIGLSLFLITCLLIFSHIWKIAAAKIGAIQLLPDQLLWYIAFNEWVLISIPDLQEGMEEDLRSGKFAYILPRPMSYLGATFFEGLGVLCVNLFVLGVVAFAFVWITVGHLPFSNGAFLVTLFVGLLAGCVGIIFQMLIGVSAFWLQEVGPFNWIWEKLLFSLGGLLLPLSVYPQWLQTIARCTPFPAILGDRSALALQFGWSDVFYLMGVLLFWSILGIVCLGFLYRKGLNVYRMQG